MNMKNNRRSFDSLTYSLWGIFALTILSGAFLLVYYVPFFSQAFASAEKLNSQVPFGWMVRRLHAAGGTFLFLLLFIHLLRVFGAGVYKDRPARFWLAEVFLVAFAAWANISGAFLPLSQEALWGMAASLSGLSGIPWIGGALADFLRGGKELGGAALSRFFSLHLLAAALIGLLLFGHSRMKAGAVAVAEEENASRDRNLFTAGILAILLLAGITFAPHWFADPLREAGNPSGNPTGIVGLWPTLFVQEALSFLGTASPFWFLLILVIVKLLVLFLPYYDRGPERSLLLRPFSLIVGSGLLVLALYFTFLGMAGAHYGERAVIAVSPASAAEVRGAQVYLEKNCAFCHQVFGREGRREGPDMAVVLQRGRSADWVQRFIMNARLYQPGTTMPKYDLPLSDLEALRAYLMSLDPAKKKFGVVERSLLGEQVSFGVWGDEKK
jgi:quinol-cytochrome oxidoreductase complex cytochrome b subunit